MTSDLLSDTSISTNIDLISAWIEAQMAYRGQPGLSIGIGHDQELLWSRGFGYADRDSQTAATADTIYRCASITKLFTATAILQLRDAGKLQLDDPITRHLPWFNIQSEFADAPPVTIRHLITHTSGLPREAAFPYWTDSNFPTTEQIRAKLPQQEAILPTETKWKYSNLALSLAGEIVAAVSDVSYTDYIQAHILDPLGMESTCITPVDPDHPQLATGYGRRLPDGTRAISPYSDCRGITPAANIASTVHDLARFAMAHLRENEEDGPQILRPSTLREMKRIHWLQEDWKAGWGLGFYVWRHNGKTYSGHGGALQGYRTDIQLCPADKTFAIVLTNADDGNPLMYMTKIFDWVFPPIVAATTEEEEKTFDGTAWQPYLGKYRSAWGDQQVLILDDELILIDPSLPDPSVAVTKLIPVAEHTFRMETTEGFGKHGELATFVMDDSGEVQALKTGDEFTYPVVDW